MKTNITKNLIVLCLISLVMALGACSKYEDGPWISCRSAKSRLYGEYHIVYFSKNGIDVSLQWKDSCDWTFKYYDNIDTKEVEDILYYEGHYFQNGTEYEMYFYSEFSLFNHNKSLSLSMLRYQIRPYGNDGYDSIGIFPLQTGEIRTFTIIRLTETELWLKYIAGDDTYKIKMEEL